MQKFFKLLCLVAFLVALTGCRRDQEMTSRTSGFDDFIPRYNTYINTWLKSQQEATLKAIVEAEVKLQSEEVSKEEVRVALEKTLTNLQREKEKWEFRLSLGDYFRYADPSEIPADLVWEDGMQHEEIGDPRAIKGGTFNVDIRTFPPTLRGFGDNSNNSFRSAIYDDIDMRLVGLHPKSMEMIPGIAKRWAVSKDGRTVYFEIDEDATYSDGVAVKARDYLFESYLRISDNIVNPYAKQYWKEEIAGFVTYGDNFLSVSLPEAKIFAPAVVGSVTPSQPEFYKDYGPDFTDRYQWEFPPTTGAYEVLDKDIVKGVSITQTRVKNWWAKDKKFYRYRFNPDRIRHVVVRDESKAFELFRAGQIDTFDITRPEFWYEKSEIDPVFKGYIERYTFYSQYPALPRGLYMNVTKPLLNEKQIRIGIQHSMNWQKVIDVIFRGDYQRLDAFNQGFLGFSDPTIKARNYSITAARMSFRKAGFTNVGRDGILRRPDGTRLSVAVSYPAIPALDRMFSILQEEAKACGFDLRIDSNEATVDYKKSMLKQHDMTFSAWVISPPTPDFYQFLHSSNARDERGNLKPQTNNLWVWGRADTDLLSEKIRSARTEEELSEAAMKLQHIIHDEAFFVPAYTANFERMGSWRWVRWPDSKETRFCAPVVYEITEAHVHWIDEKMLEETMAAKRQGKSFEEVNRIFDDYRYGIITEESESVDGQSISNEVIETEEDAE